jgi:hypothetical protein
MTQEPLDYMNLVKTLFMFIQCAAIMSSLSKRDDDVDVVKDRDYELKQHYDSLAGDWQTKMMRFIIYDRVVSKISSLLLTGPTTHDV